jgi:hypothetical protein
VQAKKNLAALFKISDEQVERLFSGKPITLKKSLEFDTANKYRVAIKKAGCIAELVECKASEPIKTDAPSKAAPVPPPANSHSPEPATAPLNSQPSAENESSALSLAPVGSDVLASSDREVVEGVQVETEHLSLAATGEDLLQAAEKQQVSAPDIHVDAELAPVGSDLLDESDKQVFEALEIDLTSMTLAEAGADLEQLDESEPAVKPDISYLSLE